MANEARAGSFYEFDRNAKGKEIKGVIPRNTALQRVLGKRDVYTPMRSDALSLAKDVQKGKAGSGAWGGVFQAFSSGVGS